MRPAIGEPVTVRLVTWISWKLGMYSVWPGSALRGPTSVAEAGVAVVKHVDIQGAPNELHHDVGIADIVDFAAAASIGLNAQAIVGTIEGAAADDDMMEAGARAASDGDAVAVEAGEVLNEDVVAAVFERHVVVADVELALADDDALAAGINSVGVGRVARRDDAEILQGDVLAAGGEVKGRRIGERDAVDVQAFDASQNEEHGTGNRASSGCVAESCLAGPQPEHGARSIDGARARYGEIGSARRAGDQRRRRRPMAPRPRPGGVGGAWFGSGIPYSSKVSGALMIAPGSRCKSMWLVRVNGRVL